MKFGTIRQIHLSALSFGFETYSAYLKSDEHKKNKYGTTFFTRSDNYAFIKDN